MKSELFNMKDPIERKLHEMQDKIALGDWEIDKTGVHRERKICRGGKEVARETDFASPIPVLPTAILRNVDSGIEKLQLSFFKHGRWQTFVTERSIVAGKNTIIRLADKGLEVNSGNAGALVRYVADVVAGSLFCLPCRDAKSVMGWTDSEFMPYTDKLAFDGDDQFRHLYKSVCRKGKLRDWAEFVAPLRANLELRLCMAASFASPVIELAGENPFVFHLWGGTGAGKTVALMVAMSVWGDPSMGKMTRTMNMTANSMLSTAAFLRNLPFAGDELQTIKSRWGNYDNLIMCITEGIDRGRMKYDQVNETKSWKCSFLFSGEEPCVKQSSGGGAKNRVIEVECRDRLVQNGNSVVNFLRGHYGAAGQPYIEKLKQTDVQRLYADWFGRILREADTTDKQAGAMALLLAADSIASELFWPGEKPIAIDNVRLYLRSALEVDVSERAFQFVCNAIAENRTNFAADAKQVWGSVEPDGVYINKNVLCRLMTDEGFDFDAVKAKWAERGYLAKSTQGRYLHARRFNGGWASFVRLVISGNVREFDEEVL